LLPNLSYLKNKMAKYFGQRLGIQEVARITPESYSVINNISNIKINQP
jgi:hypothetical protein